MILVLKGIAVSHRTERMMLIPYGPPPFIVPAGFLLGARPLPFPGRTAPVAQPLVKNGPMDKAIEQIVNARVRLQNRKALEDRSQGEVGLGL